jgi:hypothetical protein
MLHPLNMQTAEYRFDSEEKTNAVKIRWGARMAISAEKVETLRRKIATEKEIAKIWEYFFDGFTGSPGFMEAGETCGCRELDDRLELMGRHAFGKPRVVVSDQAWGHVS